MTSASGWSAPVWACVCEEWRRRSLNACSDTSIQEGLRSDKWGIDAGEEEVKTEEEEERAHLSASFATGVRSSAS